MGSKMKNAPVYLAVAQVIFNPILALDTYATSIQENLRKHGFPDVQEGTLNTFNLTMDAGRSQVPVTKHPQYSFFDIARTSGFVLNQRALTFQTSEYDVFETFTDQFLGVLDIVHKAVELSFVERIGLRYLDAVLPKHGEALQAYLNECVHGLYGKVANDDATLFQTFSETVFRREGVHITSRCVISHGELGYPPDLMPQAIALPTRFEGMHGNLAMLDTDGSLSGRTAFSVEDVGARLGKIHMQIGDVFRSMVTAHALETWA